MLEKRFLSDCHLNKAIGLVGTLSLFSDNDISLRVVLSTEFLLGSLVDGLHSLLRFIALKCVIFVVVILCRLSFE